MPPPKDLIVPGDGELTIEQMQEIAEGGRDAFERCYRAAFEYAPELWGRINMRYHVDEHGRLVGVYQKGSRFPDKRVSQCILREARKLSAVRPKGGEIRFFAPIRLHTDRADTRQPEP